MAKASHDRIEQAALQALDDVELSGGRLVVGLSGGVDSVVLLHVLHRLRHALRAEVSAVHVHHGLSPNADRWAQFCEQLCAELHVACSVVRVCVARDHALGLEAAAREARYDVYRAQSEAVVALAHHRDDQAETVLLQLLRGAGVRGMSAMPRVRALDRAHGVQIVRPLLEITREEIVRYAQAHELRWIEDESNADVSFARNFVRSELLPLIRQRFPAAPATLARAAENAADASRLLDMLAGIDAQGAVDDGGVRVTALRSLPPERARNLVRWLMERDGLAPPSRERLEEALRQALEARADARVAVDLGPCVLRRHRGRLSMERPVAAAPDRWSCEWHGEQRLDLPADAGCISFEPKIGEGLALERLHEPVTVRPREGGERIRLGARRASRTLKNLLQEAGVPYWERDRLPLLFSGDNLVWVPGIGTDCRFAAQPDEAGLLVTWQPAAH